MSKKYDKYVFHAMEDVEPHVIKRIKELEQKLASLSMGEITRHEVFQLAAKISTMEQKVAKLEEVFLEIQKMVNLDTRKFYTKTEERRIENLKKLEKQGFISEEKQP